MKGSSIQFNTLRYSLIHFDTLGYVTIQFITLRYVTIHFDTLGYVTIHFNTLRYSLIHLGRMPCGTFASFLREIGVSRAEQASSGSVLSSRGKSIDGHYHRLIITSADE